LNRAAVITTKRKTCIWRKVEDIDRVKNYDCKIPEGIIWVWLKDENRLILFVNSIGDEVGLLRRNMVTVIYMSVCASGSHNSRLNMCL
jgi:hypothetical protein